MVTIDDIRAIDAPDLPTHYHPLTEAPLWIVVGLTGVGKSTTLAELYKTGLVYETLPNRRDITDQFIITPLQFEAGLPSQPERDRLKRFEYTCQYRERHFGGMAHALSRIAVPSPHNALLFDGLRGIDEIKGALRYFPQAGLIVLDAPDMVRLSRLLTRGDRFDQVDVSTDSNSTTLVALTAIPDVEAVFTPADLQQLATQVDHGLLNLDTVVQKTTIIVAERRNYDSQAVLTYLAAQADLRDRYVVVDTAAYSPSQVAQKIIDWLSGP